MSLLNEVSQQVRGASSAPTTPVQSKAPPKPTPKAKGAGFLGFLTDLFKGVAAPAVDFAKREGQSAIHGNPATDILPNAIKAAAPPAVGYAQDVARFIPEVVTDVLSRVRKPLNPQIEPIPIPGRVAQTLLGAKEIVPTSLKGAQQTERYGGPAGATSFAVSELSQIAPLFSFLHGPRAASPELQATTSESTAAPRPAPITTPQLEPFNPVRVVPERLPGLTEALLGEVTPTVVKPKTRGFVTTVKESPFTAPEVARSVRGEYTPVSLKELAGQAADFVDQNFDEALRVARTADPTAETNAIAQAAVARLQELGRHGDAVDIVQRVAENATKSGQANAALALYSRLDPVGVLRFAQTTFEQANAKNPRLGLELTPEMARELQGRATEVQALPEGSRERTVATAQLLKTIADQVPASTAKKVSTIQTFAQLLNPKTLIRNIAGNTGFAAAENVSNVVGTGLDKLASLFTGERTQTLPSLPTQAQGAVRGTAEGFQDARLGIDTSPESTQFDLPQGRVFKGGAGAAAEQALNVALRVPDRAAWQAAFDESVRNQLDSARLSGKKVTPKVRAQIEDLAKYDAAYRTFQDENVITRVFQGLKKGLNAGKEFGLGDLVLKYPKTPGSILARGIEYSPAGFVKGVLELGKPLFGREFNQREFVRSTSRAVVGTTTGVVTGAILHRLGVITGLKEKNKNVNALRRESGLGDYRINVSALKRLILSRFNPKEAALRKGDTIVNYDWFQPGAINLSMGANIDAHKGRLGGVLGTVLDSMAGGAETVASQPLVKGVQQFFQGQTITDSLIQTATGAPASFVPTLFNQIRQLIDNTARSTYDPNPALAAVAQVVTKIPGLSKTLPAQVGVLGGDREVYQGKSNNLLNVFLNPAFVTKYTGDQAAEIALRSYEQTGAADAVPKLAPKTVTLQGRTIDLSSRQLEDYQRFIGQLAEKAFTKQAQEPGFASLSPEEQTKKLASVLSAISSLGRLYVLQNIIKGGNLPQQLRPR